LAVNKPDKYRCPHCGEMVTFGKHFCLINSTEESSNQTTKSENPGSFKKIGVILIVATLAGGMLWPFLGIYALFVGLIILLIIAVILSFTTRRQNNGGSYYKKLLSMVGGQKDVAERLISSEERKYPSMTRSECIRRVHDRLEYENYR